ncbi:hypothetical protein HB780_14520 [Rhizobium lusitanum]|uniref:hypothetical protein n=1 Tax=Rhizobium lusitanum TaxID=293958 RepID=UPI00161CE7F6|nr:hypothetical protein [Rhizobium lusitanum]QND46950.1 hypothetical protein HB780_14520 [Rhizobium lusitanum]
MGNLYPILLSIASFALSLFTLWVTQFRRGHLKMTQPALLCLMREQPSGRYKFFIRTLLYSTASKGCAVEHMFARIQTTYGSYLFDFWGHTESGKLTLGSGLFVGQAGVCADHHFNPRRDANEFFFCDGDYHIEIFAKIVGRGKPQKLKELKFTIDSLQAATLIQIMDTELYLYWNAESANYDSELRKNNEMFPLEPPKFPSWFNPGGQNLG